MGDSDLVRLAGFPATLIHGDTMVLDRWLWLKKRLPRTADGEKFIEIGCGSGTFTIGAALRGYSALGLSWDERNQRVAAERATLVRATSASFEVLDVRHLDTRQDLLGSFDVAVCFETIEHILDDRKLFQDAAACLKPGGTFLLTTPYRYYRPINSGDSGAVSRMEDGGHVRRGYSSGMLLELCATAGLACEDISFCSGFISQKLTRLLRAVSRLHPLTGWAVILPFRVLPPLLDRPLTAVFRWPYYSICLEAYKPRFFSGGIKSFPRNGESPRLGNAANR